MIGRNRPGAPGPALRRRRRTLAARLLALTPLTVLSGCIGILNPQGPVGEAQRTMMVNASAIMLIVVLPVILLSFVFGWWFRAGNDRAAYRPNWAYSGRVELVVWSVPLLIVFFLGSMAWIGSHDLEPSRSLAPEERTLEVQVVSTDWKWLFIYPSLGVASVNELSIPQGTPVRFRLTSASVMTAFFVPQLGSMIYTMNGMETRLHLQADNTGTFEGLASHYSGDGFPTMRFAARSLAPDEFERWVRETRERGGRLDRESYASLIRPSSSVAPFTFGAVEPGLFDAVVERRAPEAPGPREAPIAAGDESPAASAMPPSPPSPHSHPQG